MEEKNFSYFDMSFAQKEAYALAAGDDNGSCSNAPVLLLFRDKVDIVKLQAALNTLITRHQALRTSFEKRGGLLLQKLAPPDECCIEDATSHIHSLDELVSAITIRQFNTGQFPLYRLTLYRVTGDRYLLVFDKSSIITDACADNLLIADLLRIYFDKAGEGTTLSNAAYTQWQDNFVKSPAGKTVQDLFTRPFMNYRRSLPVSGIGAPGRGYTGNIRFTINGELLAAARIKCEEFKLPIASLLLSCMYVILFRLLDTKDIVVACTFNGRNKEAENLVGYFENKVPLRRVLDPEEKFLSFWRSLFGNYSLLEKYQSFPFYAVRDTPAVNLTSDWNDLFTFGFSYNCQSAVLSELLALCGASLISPVRSGPAAAQCLGFSFMEGSGEISADITLRHPMGGLLFEKVHCYFLECLTNILSGDPTIGAVNIIPSVELEELTSISNGPAEAYFGGTLTDLFKARVTAHKDRIAIVYEDMALTYGELNARSNQLAHCLILEYGVRPGTIVGLQTKRGPGMVIGILGIQKAGAAYLPIDVDYPEDRIKYMLGDAAVKTVIVDDYKRSVPDSCYKVLLGSVMTPAYSTADPEVFIAADNLAYVMYTSGSTGRPKGVMLDHSGVVNRIEWMWKHYGFNEADVILQKTFYGFDVSVWEIFMSLGYGACQVQCKKDKVYDVEKLVSLIRRHRVTALHFVPSMLSLFLDELNADQQKQIETFRYVFSSGEALATELVRKYYARLKAPLNNLYGPTEASVDVTYYPANGKEDRIPIGSPIWNTQIYILDESHAWVPIGVEGEIYIGGVGLARGYLNRPELTHERFIAHPFMAGGRLYKSGDRGRWQHNGTVEYLGRKDHQVKVRGYRVELEEIEKVIRIHPGVKDAWVEINEKDAGDRYIAAVIVPGKRTLYAAKQLLKYQKSHPRLLDELHYLPNGMAVFSKNSSETAFAYKEIFEEHSYGKFGIELGAGDVVLDIGANIGMFSLFILSNYPGVKVYAFEPIPPVYELLKATTALYDTRDVNIYNIGVSDRESETVFTYYPNNTMLSGRYANQADDISTMRVYLNNQLGSEQIASEDRIEEVLLKSTETEEYHCLVDTLSNIIRKHSLQQINLLKIDVEKGELDVLNGLDEKDWEKIAQIVVEVHDIDNRLETIAALLTGKGFSVSVDQEDSLRGTNLYNLYCVKRDVKKTHASKTYLEKQAYWLSISNLSQSIQDHCRKWLPEFMVPSELRYIETTPVSHNGKIDRAALSRMKSISSVSNNTVLPPKNDTEEQLVSIWMQLLDKKAVSTDASFFRIGGYSLKAIQMISRIHKMMGVKIELRALFSYPTIIELGALIQSKQEARYEAIYPVARQEYYELSDAQKRLWLQQQLDPASGAYNVGEAYRLNGALDPRSLQAAFDTLIERHESLRTVFISINGEPKQLIKSPSSCGFSLVYKDLAEDTTSGEKVATVMQEQLDTPFNLEEGPLLRAGLWKTGEQETMFTLIMHHIISDGWSMQVLIDDLLVLYNAYSQGCPNPLPPLQIQYKDYVQWQREKLEDKQLAADRQYWHAQFAGELPVLAAPADFKRPAIKTYNGNTESIALGEILTKDLRIFSQQQETTLFMTLLACVKALLYGYTDQEDIIIGTPVAGRDHVELENQIGLYANTVALRTQFSGRHNFTGFLKNIRKIVLDAYDHQLYPFDNLVSDLRLLRDRSRLPLFDTWIVLENYAMGSPADLKLAVSNYNIDIKHSRYDLKFILIESEKDIHFTLNYNTDLFRKQTISNLIRHFTALAGSALATPGASLNELVTLMKEKYVRGEETIAAPKIRKRLRNDTKIL